LTGLNLFQKLFALTRLSNASPFTQEVESEEVRERRKYVVVLIVLMQNCH